MRPITLEFTRDLGMDVRVVCGVYRPGSDAANG